ncbi:MAG TPA: diacylglycerol kinase family protein [Candidatus Dormibacteraeota bacterium]|nr:diacylglycerol kinase family protein [Candidatus Dormibacteraeota bacterium]
MSAGEFFAVVNPAAGNGRCGKLAGAALDRLREAGVKLQVAESARPGHASELVREAYRNGQRRFLAIGGDGTVFEIVNGLFPAAQADSPPELAILPLGTGNSFLRDFTDRPGEAALEAIRAGRTRLCDVLRLEHGGGVLHFINLLSLGFAADVAAFRNRHFRRGGQMAYLASVVVSLARLKPQSFPLRVEDDLEFDRRGCLFLSFNNSRFTGGTMMIAPDADPRDGLIELVRWGAIGRLGLLWNLPGLYSGAHIRHPLASRRPVRRVEFAPAGPVNVMVDGESLRVECRRMDVLASALAVVV